LVFLIHTELRCTVNHTSDLLDLELQGNDNTSATETYITMEVETEVQNQKETQKQSLKPQTGQLRLSAELKK